MPPYSFNAMHLAARRYNPQLINMGTIELHLDELIPGASRILSIGLKGFTMPQATTMASEPVKFMNGSINFPTEPEVASTFKCTFVDYMDGGQRAVLHKWFDLVYDARTGLGMLPSDMKIDAHVVKFAVNGAVSHSYYFFGIWPMTDPPMGDVSYEGGGGGSILDMPIDFKMDGYEEEKLGLSASAALGFASPFG